MNLSAMTMKELEALRQKLEWVSTAGAMLQRGGLEPRIDLTPGQAGKISFPTVFDTSMAPHPEASVTFPTRTEFLQAVGVVPDGPVPDLTDSRATKEFVTAPMPPVNVKVDLTGAQRSEIYRRWCDGQSLGRIATEMGLHFPQVRGIVGGLAAKAKRQETKPDRCRAGEKTHATGGPIKGDGVMLVGQTMQDAADARTSTPDLPVPDVPVPDVPSPEWPVPPRFPEIAQQVTVIPPKRPAVPDELTGESRQIWAHVQRLGSKGGLFDAATDRDIVDRLSRGSKLAEVALDLGIDAPAIRDRFSALTATIRTVKGVVMIEGQKRLLEVLRLRAAMGEVAA